MKTKRQLFDLITQAQSFKKLFLITLETASLITPEPHINRTLITLEPAASPHLEQQFHHT